MLAGVDKKAFIKTMVVVAAMTAVAVLFFISDAVRQLEDITAEEGSHIELIGGDGERIYLKQGTIYAVRDDPAKEYEVVYFTFHVDSEMYRRIIFFDSPELAEAAGYVPSEEFIRDYECYKQGIGLFECDDYLSSEEATKPIE